MARYEHLPIFRDAYDLAKHIENIVRNFSRYHKYSLGAELRHQSRQILLTIVDANSRPEKRECLLALRGRIEAFKITARLCHDSGGFSCTRSYLHIAERISVIARQNEGWLKKAT